MTLPAVINADEMAALRSAMGVDPTADRGPKLPQLKILMDDFDKDDNPLPKGSFFLSGKEPAVYAKEIKIRVMAHHFQYSDYDNELNKMRNKTILATTFRSDFPDMKGTLRCGRPASKVFKELSDEAKKKYDSITCFRIIRGIVSYTGKTLAGEEVVVENEPFIMRLKGSNFMGFDEQFASKLPSGRDLWDFWVNVTPKREKNGSVTYFVMQYAPEFTNPAAFDMPTVETIRGFSSMVSQENAQIMASHNKALRGHQEDGEIFDDLADGLEDDFVDHAA